VIDTSSQHLWELFVDEGLATLRQCLDLLAAPPTPWNRLGGLLEAMEAQSALMGVVEVSELAREAKQLALAAAGAREAPLDLAGALQDALVALQPAFSQLQVPDASGAHLDPAPLQAALQLLRGMPRQRARRGASPGVRAERAEHAPPAVTTPTAEPQAWVPQVDEDMVDPFIEECSERIESLATQLVLLESTNDPELRSSRPSGALRDEAAELVRSVFRDLHTLKGSSGFVGLPQMNRLAHAAEDLVGQIRDGSRAPDQVATDALLAALDGLRAVLDQAAARGPIDVAVDPLISRLRSDQPAPIPDEPATADSGAFPAPPTEPPRARGGGPPPECGPSTRDTGPAHRPTGLTLRVDFDKLDLLLNLVGELVLGKARIHEVLGALHDATDELDSRRRRVQPAPGTTDDGRPLHLLEGLSHDLDAATSRLDTVSSELRDQVMALRMVPIAGLLNKYRRVLRDLSRSVGKEVELEIRGAETELDKLLVEQLDDPLLHLVRNAIDHGIELPDLRDAAGKPRRGQVRLAATHRGHQIVIEVSDDGAGIDAERVGAKALDRGLVTADELSRMDRHQKLELIFLPGLSTASRVTGMSGRGVGMDVVREAIIGLKGNMEIYSTPGAGTRFELRLPLTLAISNVLLCRAGGQVLAVPIHAVQHTLMADPNRTREVAAYPTLRLDEEVPLIDVAASLGLAATHQPPPFPVALVESLGTTFGLVFDQLLGRREIVIKSLGSLLERVPCCAGTTLLGERCALILDVHALIRRALESPAGLTTSEGASAVVPTVLVAEDSDTVREDLRRTLSAAGFAVQEARDGNEALELAHRFQFDLVSTDVMMPGMDGYDLCRRLRQLPAYEQVPLIMLTGRDQEIDRIRGFDAGIDAYLVKPVNRAEMTALVRRLIDASAGSSTQSGGG